MTAGLLIGRAIIRSNYYVADYAGSVSIMRGFKGRYWACPCTSLT